jgi:ribonuclease HII
MDCFIMETQENKKTAVIKTPLDRFYDESVPYEIAIDECGRGPLFGRVYVGCVVLPKDPVAFDGKDIKDSKKFSSKKKLKAVAEYIKSHALAWHVSWVDEKVIDEINILQANMRAMHEGIDKILEKFPSASLGNCLAVVDGNYFTPFRRFEDASQTIVEMPSITIEQGDAKHMGIAAASILAKAARDDYILELCEKHPELVTRYKLDTNMGYGTKAHLDGIRAHGISQWHRRTFGELCKKSEVNVV